MCVRTIGSRPTVVQHSRNATSTTLWRAMKGSTKVYIQTDILYSSPRTQWVDRKSYQNCQNRIASNIFKMFCIDFFKLIYDFAV